MKNYPHLYTPATKKASFSNQIKTHKKTTSIAGNNNEYTKNPSSKTINPTNKPQMRRGNQTPRISSRSIQEMYVDRSSEDNYDMMQRKKMLLEEHRQMNQFYPPPTFGEFSYKQMPMSNYNSMQYNNYQVDRYSVQSNEESELFQRSYDKIGQIKYHIQNKNIDLELNEVLELIKEQKLRANQTVKTLKKAAEHYKKLCENASKSYIDTSINTEQQLPYFKEVETTDRGIQYENEQRIKTREASPTFAKIPEPVQEIPETQQTLQSPKKDQSSKKEQSPKRYQSPSKEEEIIGKQKQIYTKLATMLEDMNINSKQILPEDFQLNFEVKDYKNLSEVQIIKIQKFFIKKLVEKIPK